MSSKLTIIMQAKKDLYFLCAGKPPVLYMEKGSLRVMYGKVAGRTGYSYIEFNDENFRFFFPLDMMKPSLE